MTYSYLSHPILNRILVFLVVFSLLFTLAVLKPMEAHASPLLLAGAIAPYLVPIMVSMCALGIVFTDTVTVVPILESVFNGLSSTIRNSLSTITEQPETVTLTPSFLSEVQSATMSRPFIQAMINGDLQYRILSESNYKLLQFSNGYGALSSAMEDLAEKAIQYIPVAAGVDAHLMGNFWLRLIPYLSTGAFQLFLVEKSGSLDVATEWLSNTTSSQLHYDTYGKPFYFGFYTWFYEGIIRMAIRNYEVNSDGTYGSSPSETYKIYDSTSSEVADIFMGLISSGAAFADGSAITSGLTYNPGAEGVINPQTQTEEKTYSIPAPPLPVDIVGVTAASLADGVVDGDLTDPESPTDPEEDEDGPFATYIKNLVGNIVKALALGAAVLATLATAGTDLMDAVANMFSWLPNELEMAILATLSVMVAFSIFKFLRG